MLMVNHSTCKQRHLYLPTFTGDPVNTTCLKNDRSFSIDVCLPPSRLQLSPRHTSTSIHHATSLGSIPNQPSSRLQPNAPQLISRLHFNPAQFIPRLQFTPSQYNPRLHSITLHPPRLQFIPSRFSPRLQSTPAQTSTPKHASSVLDFRPSHISTAKHRNTNLDSKTCQFSPRLHANSVQATPRLHSNSTHFSASAHFNPAQFSPRLLYLFQLHDFVLTPLLTSLLPHPMSATILKDSLQ